MTLTTYLNFGGNCREALAYYERHLGAKIGMVMTFGQMPGGRPEGAAPMPADGVMHARVEIGGADLMASDTEPGRFQPMRSAYLVLGAGSTEDAEKMWAALADGGEIFMPITETFFAHRYGILRDRFGINWMVMH